MSVFYKFKSALTYDTLLFDDLHITLGEFKKAVIEQKQLGKGSNFDLQVTNAETNKVYTDDSSLIPKNSSLILVRIPLAGSSKKLWDSGTGSKTGIVDTQEVVGDIIVKSADLVRSNASEHEKIQAMIYQSTIDYDPANYLRNKVLSHTGEPPASYICHKCQNHGHWIKDCPVTVIPDVKKSSGIPSSFMTPVDDPSVQGALITPDGTFAVPTVDLEAYKQGKKEKPFNPFEEMEETENRPVVPEDLLCSLCEDILTDAVMIPCCGISFCDECIRNVLIESEDNECPDCKEKDQSPEMLIPNRFLRNSVNNFRNKTGYRGGGNRPARPAAKANNEDEKIDNDVEIVMTVPAEHKVIEEQSMEMGSAISVVGLNPTQRMKMPNIHMEYQPPLGRPKYSQGENHQIMPISNEPRTMISQSRTGVVAARSPDLSNLPVMVDVRNPPPPVPMNVSRQPTPSDMMRTQTFVRQPMQPMRPIVSAHYPPGVQPQVIRAYGQPPHPPGVTMIPAQRMPAQGPQVRVYHQQFPGQQQFRPLPPMGNRPFRHHSENRTRAHPNGFPGDNVVLDPLIAFERHLQERDMQSRMRQQRRRSRSRSRSSHSRSLSPLRKRSRGSRSLSKGRSKSPVHKEVISKRSRSPLDKHKRPSRTRSRTKSPRSPVHRHVKRRSSQKRSVTPRVVASPLTKKRRRSRSRSFGSRSPSRSYSRSPKQRRYKHASKRRSRTPSRHAYSSHHPPHQPLQAHQSNVDYYEGEYRGNSYRSADSKSRFPRYTRNDAQNNSKHYGGASAQENYKYNRYRHSSRTDDRQQYVPPLAETSSYPPNGTRDSARTYYPPSDPVPYYEHEVLLPPGITEEYAYEGATGAFVNAQNLTEIVTYDNMERLESEGSPRRRYSEHRSSPDSGGSERKVIESRKEQSHEREKTRKESVLDKERKEKPKKKKKKEVETDKKKKKKTKLDKKCMDESKEEEKIEPKEEPQIAIKEEQVTPPPSVQSSPPQDPVDVMLASVPGLSKWELDESPVHPEPKSREPVGALVTNEIIKHAENVLFQKGGKSAPKGEEPPPEVGREARKSGTSIKITVPSTNKSTSPPVEEEKRPSRVSAKERLGVKVSEEQRYRSNVRSMVVEAKKSSTTSSARPVADRSRRRDDRKAHSDHHHRATSRNRRRDDRHETTSRSERSEATRGERRETHRVDDRSRQREKSSTTRKPSRREEPTKPKKETKVEEKPLALPIDEKKVQLDEASFEPNYDLESETEEAKDPKESKDSKEKESSSNSSSSSDSDSTSSDERAKRKKRRKAKRKKKRKKKKTYSSDSESAESSESEDSEESDGPKQKKKKKHKHKSKKRVVAKKKKRTKHKV